MTIYINPNFEESAGNVGRAWYGSSLAPMAYVSADGETMSIYVNFIERLTRITGMTLDMRGEVVGWELIRSIVISTDGVTWSAPMTHGQVLAYVFDPALPTYLGFIFTGTGTPAGDIALWHVNIAYTFSYSGVNGRRDINPETMYTRCKQIIEQLVNQISPLYDERQHFQFAWGTGEKCVPDGNRPNVFVHDLKTREVNRNSNHRQMTVGFRLGIRRKCSKEHQYFEEFRGIIKRRLGEAAQEYTYNFTVDGVVHLGVTLADMGFWGVRTMTDAEISGSDQSSKELACGCTWWETSVELQILFKFGKNIR